MTTSGYRELPVAAPLAAHVACIWVSEVPAGAGGGHLVLPDGCIDLLVEAERGEVQVVGTMTRALPVTACGPARFVGVRFRPGGAVAFLGGGGAGAFTDRMIDAETVFGGPGRAVRDRVGGRATPAVARELERFLLDRPGRSVAAVEPRIAWATAALRTDPGLRVDALAARLELSRQHTRRLFLTHTGLTPKAFARVSRLERLVAVLDRGTPLVQAAGAAGYADQAHMTRETRALTGHSPAALARQRGVPFVQDRTTARR